jgi:hypothetical protein
MENKYIEQEISKTMPFTISSKLSRENQIKYIKCLYESYITMVKEVERDKMKGTPMFMEWKTTYCENDLQN